jgi:hypothetical protein
MLRAGQARSATCRIDASVYYREYKACECLSNSCSGSLILECFTFHTTARVYHGELEEVPPESTYHQQRGHRPLSSTPTTTQAPELTKPLSIWLH